jgi:hypothetical protein
MIRGRCPRTLAAGHGPQTPKAIRREAQRPPANRSGGPGASVPGGSARAEPSHLSARGFIVVNPHRPRYGIGIFNPSHREDRMSAPSDMENGFPKEDAPSTPVFDVLIGALGGAALIFRVMVPGGDRISSAYEHPQAMVSCLCRLMAVFFGVLALEQAAVRGRLRLPRSPLVWASLLFAAALAAGWMIAPDADRADSVAMDFAAAFFFGIGAFQCARRPAARSVLMACAIAALAAVALLAVEQRVAGLELQRVEYRVEVRRGGADVPAIISSPAGRARMAGNVVYSVFIVSNTLAGWLAVALPLAAAVFISLPRITRRDRLAAGLALLTVIAGLAALVFTRSRGGGLAAAAAGAMFIIAFVRRRGLPRWSWLAPFAATAALVICAALFAPRHPDAPNSFDVRREYWSAAVGMIKDRPAGVGIGHFGLHYPKYETLLGWGVQTPHNDYLAVAAESGLFAGLALLALVAVFFLAWRGGEDGARDDGLSPDSPRLSPSRWAGLAAAIACLVGLAMAMVTVHRPLDPFHIARMFKDVYWNAVPGLVLTAFAYSILIPIVAAAVAWAAARADFSHRVWRAALPAAFLGFALHALVDFDIDTPGFSALLAVIIGLAAGWAHKDLEQSGRTVTIKPVLALVAGLVVLFSLLSWGVWRLVYKPLNDGLAVIRAEGSGMDALVTPRENGLARANAWAEAARRMQNSQDVLLNFSLALNHIYADLDVKTYSWSQVPSHDATTRWLRVDLAERAHRINPQADRPLALLGQYALFDAIKARNENRDPGPFIAEAGMRYAALRDTSPLNPLLPLLEGDAQLLYGAIESAAQCYSDGFDLNRRGCDQGVLLQYVFDYPPYAFRRTSGIDPLIEAVVFQALVRACAPGAAAPAGALAPAGFIAPRYLPGAGPSAYAAAPVVRLRFAYQCAFLRAQPWQHIYNPVTRSLVNQMILPELDGFMPPDNAAPGKRGGPDAMTVRIQTALLRKGVAALDELIRDHPDFEPVHARIFLGYFRDELGDRAGADAAWREAWEIARANPAISAHAFALIATSRRSGRTPWSP